MAVQEAVVEIEQLRGRSQKPRRSCLLDGVSHGSGTTCLNSSKKFWTRMNRPSRIVTFRQTTPAR